ncbi:MAG: glycosyltransferase [Flavobacteriaceae bacterium]|jgi:glycosyltransferase involved in cell wall biosynthesis|nr:glycosyltransferase [Flavobacteriaceae bacterium]
MQQYMVSVVMITYNHEKYIQQAIESILMQECTFEYELIISNDCSPDNTHKIIQGYLSGNNSIKYFSHEKNLGVIPNFLFALNQANGKYIAICEGDDYWTDPLKLQKQVDFMENNPDFSIIFHQVQVLENDILTNETYPLAKNVKDISTIEDLSKNNYIPTLSVLYKNSHTYPSYIKDSFIGDYPLHLYNAEKGKIKFIPEIMGIYRKGVGVWSSEINSIRNKKMLLSLFLISDYYKNNKVVYHNLRQQQKFYLYAYLKDTTGKKQSALSILFKDKLFKNVPLMDKLYILLKFLLKKNL